jgi:CRP-like cAMP-binding protein
MSVEIEKIKNLDLFKSLNEEEIKNIAELITPLQVTEGEELACAETLARYFFIILSGNFMVSFTTGRAITLHKKGEIMGWSTLISPFYYTGTLTALTKGEVLSISANDLMDLIQKSSNLGNNIMGVVNQIMRDRMPFFTKDIVQEDTVKEV